jgi:hypothetical protein
MLSPTQLESLSEPQVKVSKPSSVRNRRKKRT